MNKLYILVEGDDDERFFDKIIKPLLREKYYVKIVKYAEWKMKKEKIENFIRSCQSMKADYIYVTDLNASPCVTVKKEEIMRKLEDIEESKIIVVKREIESWYLAGLKDSDRRKLGIKRSLSSTENVTKEQFNTLLRDPAERINVMIEILKRFSIDTAKQKNSSFKYFMEKKIEKMIHDC
ncbi:MAG: hypothetical protein QXO16_00290 [Archaeoglobaceae archaeon]